MKRIKFFVRLSSAVLLTAAFCAAGMTAGEAAVPEMRPMDKTLTYPMDDSYNVALDPNVLFLLDTGSPMVMAPWGTMPTPEVEPNADRRIALFADCTYGTGARPYTSGTTEQGDNINYSRYGRDLDPKNNIIGDPLCYYTPYPSKPYFLTFKNQNWANWNGVGTPSGMPAALQTYLPGKPNAGKPVPPNLTQYLVPNDSRMYQMKLVLWRLLSEENQALLSRMKTAMAISYQEANYGDHMWADFYKISPYGAGQNFNSVWDENRWVNNKYFSHGSGPSWSMGTRYNYIETNYKDATRAYAGINRDYYDAAAGSAQWLTVNRAVLKLPFDYLYKATSAGFVPTTNLRTFQSYINGVEAANGSTLLDPELIADGKTPLATAIYGRDYHLNGANTQNVTSGHKAIHFETGRGTIKQWYGSSYVEFQDYQVSDEVDETGQKTLRAGLATGSVVDFFSPRSQNLAFGDGTAGKVDTRGYFPVIGSCQSNWLVVFTAGNDSDPHALSAPEAVHRLYMNTRTIQGRYWNKQTNKWEGQSYLMDNGVRTLVVGFVDPENPKSSELVRTLNDMAAYGDPHPDGTPNPDKKAYLANDVPSLIASLKAVLMRINADRFPPGASVSSNQPDGQNNVMRYSYSPSYTVSAYDQWEGWFTKYKRNDYDELEEVWEVNEELYKAASSRQIYTTKEYQSNLDSTTLTRVDSLGADVFSAMTGLPQAHAGSFKDWLVRYRASGGVDRRSILGDMEHAGFSVITDPKALYGTDERNVYLQTNRGFLHAIDDTNGREIWSFIPPNIFQGRIKHLKLDGVSGAWLGGDGLTTLSSVPTNLLDGPLVTEDVRDTHGNYRKVLLGNLGWGGNGLYAMDVTPPAKEPKFLWAVDNARYGDSREAPDLIDGVRRWGALAGVSEKAGYNYSDLGLTIAVPSTISVDIVGNGPGDITLLPGGLGYRLEPNKTDTHGAALYVIDPLTGRIIRTMQESTNSFVAPNGTSRELGMLVSTAVYRYRNNDINNRTTTGFYTADTNGNVLFCDVEHKPVSEWKLESIFQLLSSAGEPIAIPKTLLVAHGSGGDIKARATDGEEWIFGGTSDLMVPDQNSARKLENPEQYIWGFNRARLEPKETPDPENPSTATNTPGNKTTADLYALPYVKEGRIEEVTQPDGTVVRRWVEEPLGDQNYGVSPEEFRPPNVTDPEYIGWALKLRPAASETEAEYVTTSPFLLFGTLYVSTFVPKVLPEDMTQRELCPNMGDAKLYALDPFRGNGRLDIDGDNRPDGTVNAMVFKNRKITGISAALKADGTWGLEISSKSLAPGSEDPNDRNILAVIGHGENTTTINTIVPYIQYWSEE